MALTVRERPDVALAAIIARKGQEAELALRMREKFGCELPAMNTYVAATTLRMAATGPRQWLAMADNIGGLQFQRQLTAELGELASIFDQSDGRTILQIQGTKVRETLAKGVLLDLDPAVFGVGSAAITSIAHIGVHFWQTDAKPTYEFAVFRSFAVALSEWLLDSAAEYGGPPAAERDPKESLA